jgi:hypothetical protein
MKHVKVSLWMQAVGLCALSETSKSLFSNSMLKSLSDHVISDLEAFSFSYLFI